MKSTSEMILIVHVPKTAGTSLRVAAEKYYGSDKVIRDYGPNAEATTDVVRRHLYQDNQDKNALIREISENGSRVLVGHFPVQKYANYFSPDRIIAFVRDPLERACSEFLHRQDNQSYTGSFEEFVSRHPLKNIQSRLLKGISDQSFVGLTEYYADSLRYLNERYSLKLSLMKRNKNSSGGGVRLSSHLSAQEKDTFLAHNQSDILLYNQFKSQFLALNIPLTRLERFSSLFRFGSSSQQDNGGI